MAKKYTAGVRVYLIVEFKDDGETKLEDQAIEAAEEAVGHSEWTEMDTKKEWISAN